MWRSLVVRHHQVRQVQVTVEMFGPFVKLYNRVVHFSQRSFILVGVLPIVRVERRRRASVSLRGRFQDVLHENFVNTRIFVEPMCDDHRDRCINERFTEYGFVDNPIHHVFVVFGDCDTLQYVQTQPTRRVDLACGLEAVNGAKHAVVADATADSVFVSVERAQPRVSLSSRVHQSGIQFP